MLKIDNVEVMGWEHAIRGMRNPKNSWEKSDSEFGVLWSENQHADVIVEDDDDWISYVGPNDRKLMMTLRNAGTDHRKFMRMIAVYLDITAPLYWWKEFDTYKVGTVANSCSTMHKIHAKEFTLNDFSHEHLVTLRELEPDDLTILSLDGEDCGFSPEGGLRMIVSLLNNYREKYLQTKNKKYWWQLIQLLPSSYNQKRTVMCNYEVLCNMYKSRRNHKLDEWRDFCDWMETLPCSELITGNAAWREWSEQDLYKIATYIQTNDPRITNSNSYIKVAINHNICNFVIDDKVLYSFDMARVTVKVATDFIRDSLNDMFKDFSKTEIISDDNSIQIQE